MRPAVFNWPAVDADAICVAQTLGAAGALTINGVLANQADVTARWPIAVLPGIERTVSAHSTGNIATVTFTVTGTSLRGATVTDTITGINNTTVLGASGTLFHTITSVTADAAVGTAVEVGTGAVGDTNWFMADNYSPTANMTVGVANVTGTIDVTVQNTLADVQAAAPAAGEIFNHPTLAALTAAAESNYAFPPRFVRAVNANTASSGSFDFTIIQGG